MLQRLHPNGPIYQRLSHLEVQQLFFPSRSLLVTGVIFIFVLNDLSGHFSRSYEQSTLLSKMHRNYFCAKVNNFQGEHYVTRLKNRICRWDIARAGSTRTSKLLSPQQKLQVFTFQQSHSLLPVKQNWKSYNVILKSKKLFKLLMIKLE